MTTLRLRGHRASLRPARLALAAILAAPLPYASGSDTARRGRTETALDRYVAQPDPAFSWKKMAEVRDGNVTGYAIEMVSQHWRSPAEVNRTEWRHWLNLIKPDHVAHPTALLFINGGNNRAGPPSRPSRDLVEIARATRSVVAELRMVPNQPLIFGNDGRERTEDDLIACTWDKFLRTGDERWPARLPMTKAAVRAMDATTAFFASAEGGGIKVDTFMVAGASKRGWTTWSTAIVDRRVVAICPVVIDVLNVEESMTHHHRSYGFFTPAVGDYVRQGIMEWMGTPELKALFAIEDPFAYRDRLSMPKLMLNACGDQFFHPESSQFYFDDLPGVKYLRYVPNADHSLRNSDAYHTLQAWHHAILNRTRLPALTWKQTGNSFRVHTDTRPRQVLLWQASNPAARDFRLESLGPVWRSTPVQEKDGSFIASVDTPSGGWTAFMVELTFDLGAGVPLKLTTPVAVTPDTLPFEGPKPSQPAGFLSR